MHTTIEAVVQRAKLSAYNFYQRNLTGNEDALVAGWFGAATGLVFAAFMTAFTGVLLESFYLYIHTSSGYTAENIADFDRQFEMLQFIPWLVGACISIFIVNYTNVSEGQ